MASILIVDDDSTVGEILLSYLNRAEMQGTHVLTGAGMHAALTESLPDLLVLDVMLPDADGVDLCAQVRARYPSVPIILLTARTEESDRIAGLTAGADDYVVKPFSPRELLLRIQSVLRRSNPQPAPPDGADGSGAGGPLRDGDLTLDRASHQATLGQTPLTLTAREFELLGHLMANPGRAFSRDELLAEVWGWNYGDKSTVTVHVRRLREKIETDPGSPTRLTTVWGVGYRWDPVEGPAAGISPPKNQQSPTTAGR